MSLLNKLFGQKRTIQSPTFVKDFTKENHQLMALSDLSYKLTDGEQKDNIERDIKLLKY
ncbi:hypothetical protein [Paenibacillus alginolyticus]|uniref:hypothetical protein n=1 Tax=Paenibacillus alginolyticus TaxID=59839 RepID=UPI001FE619E4|nr:hypothetical protein [Paenibacillus frigoriresistens]